MSSHLEKQREAIKYLSEQISIIQNFLTTDDIRLSPEQYHNYFEKIDSLVAERDLLINDLEINNLDDDEPKNISQAVAKYRTNHGTNLSDSYRGDICNSSTDKNLSDDEDYVY